MVVAEVVGFSGTIEEDDGLYRLVTSFATTAEEVDCFANLVRT